jgi:E3 ubiquitin-protein ligase MUL1
VLQNVAVLELNSDLEKILKTYPDQKLPYVAIRGKVKALGSPITSVNNLSVTGTIQQLSMKEHVVARNSAGYWFVEYILQFIFLPCITHHANGNQFGAALGSICLPGVSS